MADSKNSANSVISSIPFGNLIGGPLSACITAQADAAKTAFDYIRLASMKQDSDLGEDALEPETVSFTFQVDGQKRILVVPLLTLLPVPFISIEHVDLSFTADITSCEGTQIQAHYTAPKKDVTTEEQMTVQTENLIEVDIHAVTSEMPSGMAKLLEVFNTQLVVVEPVSEEELAALRKAHEERPVKPEPKPGKPPKDPGGVLTSDKPLEPMDRDPLDPPVHVESAIGPDDLMKMARDAYQAAVKTGGAAEIREARKSVIVYYPTYDAKVFLRATDRPLEKAPFLIRVTNTLKDNPDCEYDPTQSIYENIRIQEQRQRTDRKKLRAHLIWALHLARKMYPNTSSTTAGQKIMAAWWKARTHIKNGWYTFGGRKDEIAMKTFVDAVITAEKARQEALKKPAQQAAEPAPPASEPPKLPKKKDGTKVKTKDAKDVKEMKTPVKKASLEKAAKTLKKKT